MKKFLALLATGALALGLSSTAHAQAIEGGGLILHDPLAPTHTISLTVPQDNPPGLNPQYNAWAAGGFTSFSWSIPVPPSAGVQGGFLFAGPSDALPGAYTAPFSDPTDAPAGTMLLPYWVGPNTAGVHITAGNNLAGAYDFATPAELNLVVGVPGGYLPLSGGTMTGLIDMGGNDITNLLELDGTGDIITTGGHFITGTDADPLHEGAIVFHGGAAGTTNQGILSLDPGIVYNSSNRQYFLPDATGTLALTSDITGGTLAGSFTTLNATADVPNGPAATITNSDNATPDQPIALSLVATSAGGGGIATGLNFNITGLGANNDINGTGNSWSMSSAGVLTSAGLILTNTTSPITLTGDAGTSGQVLTSAGPNATPTWTTPSSGGVAFDVTPPSTQTSTTATNHLFDVTSAPAAGAPLGAFITSTAAAASNQNATGLTITATADGTGIARGINIFATGGAGNNAIDATGSIVTSAGDLVAGSGGNPGRLVLTNTGGSTATVNATNLTAPRAIALPDAPGTLALVASTSGAIANTDVSGLGTMSTQNATGVAITGGAIDGTTIGATTPSTGAFTGFATAITTQSANYLVNGLNHTVIETGNATTVQLFSAGAYAVGQIFTIKCACAPANTINVQPFGGDNIDGSAIPFIILYPHVDADASANRPSSVTLQNGGIGVGWYIIGEAYK